MKDYSVFFQQINAEREDVTARNKKSAAKKALKKYKRTLLDELAWIEENGKYIIEEYEGD